MVVLPSLGACAAPPMESTPLIITFEKTLGVDERPNTWERAEYSPRPGYLKVAIFT